MSERSLASAYAALAIAGLGWGLGFPFAKLALRELDASSMILLRYAIASALVLPIILMRAKTSIFTEPTILVAGTFYGIAYLVQFEGVAHTTVSMAALLIGALPVLVALTARLFFSEHITPARWTGIVLAVVGVSLVTSGPDQSSPLGIILILVSLVLCLGWIFALRRLPADVDPVAASCAVVVIGALIIVPLALGRSGVPPLRLLPLTWVVSCPLLSGPSTMTVWIEEGTTNACQEAQARGDHRQAA